MDIDFRYTVKSFYDLSLDELYEVMQLRQEVFIVEQTCPYLDADGKDQNSYHLLVYKDEKLIAYTRILPDNVSYSGYSSIGRVVSDFSSRGSGAGKFAMDKSIEFSKETFPHLPIKISAQCYLENFYNRFGFHKVGDQYLEDNIPHIAMVLPV